MPAEREPASDGEETDEDMPALQSVSSSSESEDDPIPQQRSTPEQHTGTPHLVGADFFDPWFSPSRNQSSGVDLPLPTRQSQSQRNVDQPPPPPNQPAGNDIDTVPQTILPSNVDRDEQGREERRSRDGRGRIVETSPDLILILIDEFTDRYDGYLAEAQPFLPPILDFRPEHVTIPMREQEPDYLRAKVVIDGLEPVSKDLLSRYKSLKGDGHSEQTLCVVCLDQLDLDSPCDIEDNDPLGPIQVEDKKSQEVVAFPCLHLFHSECLSVWAALNTTCPMCRYDIDPDSATLYGGCAERPWVPPAKGALEAWVQAEEKKASSCPRTDNPLEP